MPVNANGWDVNEQGNIVVTPLHRFLGAVSPDGFGLLRLEVLTDPRARQTPGAVYQIAMSAQEAASLAQALQQMAEKLAAQSSNARPN